MASAQPRVDKINFHLFASAQPRRQKSNIWQIHCLHLVAVNHYVKMYQNVPHGSRVLVIFIFYISNSLRAIANLARWLWTVKLHKNPYKQRYIADSAKCSTKPLSQILTRILTAVKEGLQKYCDTAYARSGFIYLFIFFFFFFFFFWGGGGVFLL